MRVDELNMNEEYDSEDKSTDYGEQSDYESYRSIKSKKRKATLRKKHIFLKVFLVLLLLSGILLTPVFNVKNITVRGNSFLSKSKIIDASGIGKSGNIFTFKCSKAKDGVENLSFVDVADVKRSFPGGIVINVKECQPVAQISCGQSLFLVVDKSGKILDAVDNPKKYKVPLADNVEIKEFEVGKEIKPSDKRIFSNLLILAQEIKENNISDITEKISCKDDSLMLYLDRDIRCKLGNGENLSYRVKFIKEVYKSIPKGKTGTLEFVEEYKAVFTEDENGNQG